MIPCDQAENPREGYFKGETRECNQEGR